LAIAGLLPKKNCTIDNGKILFEDIDLTTLDSKRYEMLRGNDIAIIFQESMRSLNPSMTCGKQVIEVLLKHTYLTKKEAQQEVIELLQNVKLPDPEVVYHKYPHEISGGQKQRVMIALAIACKPKLLIADEPTTALGVTVQKEIILLLKELQKTFEMSIIFSSHDLSLVSEIANRVLVMYKGEIVEQGSTKDIFKNPQHIYTKALINSKPSLNVRLKQLHY
jgi:peptide/nickel transport system ATP-binding protein